MHPKYGWNGTVSRVFPLIALIALGAFFHSTPGSAHSLSLGMPSFPTSRENLYTPPPPPPAPISVQKAFSGEGGWGCIFWGPTRQEFYTPPSPLLYTPPPLGGYFQGWGGGVGVYKIRPRKWKRWRRWRSIVFIIFHLAAKGGRQKGIGKKVTKNVKKVTKWLPKGDRNRKKWPIPFCVPPFAAQWIFIALPSPVVFI